MCPHKEWFYIALRVPGVIAVVLQPPAMAPLLPGRYAAPASVLSSSPAEMDLTVLPNGCTYSPEGLLTQRTSEAVHPWSSQRCRSHFSGAHPAPTLGVGDCALGFRNVTHLDTSQPKGIMCLWILHLRIMRCILLCSNTLDPTPSHNPAATFSLAIWLPGALCWPHYTPGKWCFSQGPQGMAVVAAAGAYSFKAWDGSTVKLQALLKWDLHLWLLHGCTASLVLQARRPSGEYVNWGMAVGSGKWESVKWGRV